MSPFRLTIQSPSSLPVHSLHPVSGMPLGYGETALKQPASISGPAKNLIELPLPKPVVPERLNSIHNEDGDGLLPSIKNGYWERFKDFAGAEGVSLVCSMIGTAGVSLLTQDPFLLTLAGPIIEKFGFLGWEIIKEAWNPSSDLSYPERLQKILAGFFNNLKTDVIFHDLMSYSPLMALGLYAFPQINPTLVSGLAFGIGVLIAPKWEQLAGEALHRFIKQIADRRHLNVESYYEARYVLNEKSNPQEIFNKMADKFDLNQQTRSVFEDVYFENQIPQWSERKVIARERKIYDETGSTELHHNFEVFTAKPELVSFGEYNIYEVEKEKSFIPLRGHETAEIIFGKRIYKKLTHTKGETIAFRRQAAFNDKVRITLDIVYVSETEAYYVIEFKGYPNSKSELHELILHFKNNYGSQATLRSKNEIITHLRDL